MSNEREKQGHDASRKEAGSRRGKHWERVHGESDGRPSWFQDEPALSLELVRRAGVAQDDPIIDIGAGSSALADRLLDAGYTDLTMLDISGRALAVSRERMVERADRVTWIAADVLSWIPPRSYALWHDRAMFHFLTTDDERAAYLVRLRAGLRIGGHAVIAGFSLEGPERCSGLTVTRYSPESLAETLGPEFELVEGREERHVTPSGATQAFQFSLLRRHKDAVR